MTLNGSALHSTLIVFGAGGGLGRAICRSGTDAGRKVIAVSSQQPGSVREAAVWLHTPELGRESELARALSEAMSGLETKPLCAIITSGSNKTPLPITEASADDFEAAFRDNLLPALNAISVLRHLNRTGLSIVVTGSVYSVDGASNNAPYVTAKHALAGLVRASAKDLRPEGISINLICPGPIRGDMLMRVLEARHGIDSAETSLHQLESARQPRGLLEYSDVALAAIALADMGLVGVSGQLIVQDN